MLSLRSIKTVLGNVLFALHILLLFLLLFESKLTIPVWLQPVGRLHPVLLHLPIGLLIMVGLLQLVRKEMEAATFRKVQQFTLLMTAAATAVAALMGLFLSQESGYESPLLSWHKWSGIGLSFLVYGLWWLGEGNKLPQRGFQLSLVVGIGLLTFTGHYGASITHGEDFVWAPLAQEETQLVITEQTPLYEAAIVPVLEQKCYQCHNNRKSKGDLNMSTRVALLKGGENGPIWQGGEAEESQLIQRARLPLEDEHHMPPEGKTQLTEAEIDLLHAWIESGANLDQSIAAYPADGSVRKLAASLMPEPETDAPKYEFAAASRRDLEALNTPFRTIRPLAIGSPALSAQIFIRQTYEDRLLEELTGVQDQLVELNLSNLPITDEDLSLISRFSQLDQLILNETDITGATLGELAACKQLRSLSLIGTQVGPEIGSSLASLPKLQEVYVWNTQISEADLSNLQQQLPGVRLDLGYIPPEGEILQLSPPIIQAATSFVVAGGSVQLKHNFPGAQIRYTLDGSTPDSLSSPLYEAPIPLDSFTVLKTRAFRENWQGSDTLQKVFFYKAFTPVSAALTYPPNPQYPAEGAQSLFDEETGDEENFASGAWMGTKKQPLEATFDFGEAGLPISHVTVSYLQSIGRWIVPPKSVEVWAGESPQTLRKVLRKTLPPIVENDPNQVGAVNLPVPEGHRYYRVRVKPRTLPKWHQGAGTTGWAFVDEVYFY
ncbi:MAG: FN3 associated domain-containing protein [Bacteroidota bacterium]